MSRSTHHWRRRLGLFLLACSLPASAATVYRTVDDKGVVSFSDVPPAANASAEKMQIDTPPAQSDALQQQRLEAMRDTTDRMTADRMAREKHRAEMRKLQAESQPPEVEYLPRDNDSIGSGYDYYAYPAWRYRRPRHDAHPGFRPPLRPPAVQPVPSYNNYPASRVRRNYDPKVRQAFRK